MPDAAATCENELHHNSDLYYSGRADGIKLQDAFHEKVRQERKQEFIAKLTELRDSYGSDCSMYGATPARAADECIRLARKML